LIIFLVGNKIDDAEKREIGTEEGAAKAELLKVQFIETSAKVGINVKALFKNMAELLPGVENTTTPA
jgi:Ras-related protein Rab-6A